MLPRRAIRFALFFACALAACGGTPSPVAPAPSLLRVAPIDQAPPVALAKAAPVCSTTAPALPLSPAKAEEISVEQLARMLPKHPIVVGFDVDDTLTFSAPAFNALQPSYDPDVIRPKDLQKLTAEQRAQYHAFWNELNEHADDSSIPKKIGKTLLALHTARKDDIYIISRRQETVPLSDVASRRLERFFQVKLAHPIVQTNLTDKTKYICERQIELYYGDSDSDITAAVAAGATPVRIKRAVNSYAKDATHDGQLDEIVIRGSEE